MLPTKKIVFTIVLITIVSRAYTQDSLEMWVNISPEIKINFEERIWEIRFRPDDHIFLPQKYVKGGNQAKMELMLGFSFWKCKFFSHSKYDQNGGFWTGARFDLNLGAFENKLLFNIQERYFFGLNEESKDHYYLIQYIRYKISKISILGILSYGKWNTGKDFNTGFWFIGPSIGFEDPKGMGIQFAFTKDVFHQPTYMTYLRLNFLIVFKNRSKPINFDTDE